LQERKERVLLVPEGRYVWECARDAARLEGGAFTSISLGKRGNLSKEILSESSCCSRKTTTFKCRLRSALSVKREDFFENLHAGREEWRSQEGIVLKACQERTTKGKSAGGALFDKPVCLQGKNRRNRTFVKLNKNL